MAQTKTKELSIVIPVFNEEDSLMGLYDEICRAVGGKYDYEVIFIDDGSTDGSLAILKDIQLNDSRVRIVRLRRNFGQTAALSAGFKHAYGAVIIPMDADGQNDPADIEKLLAKLNEGYDIVSGP